MARSRTERLTAAAGAAFGVLLLAGLVMQAVAAGGAEEETREEVVARYSDGGNELRAEIGALLVGLAIACGLVFLGMLRTTLRSAEGEPAIYSTAALAGGIVMTAMLAVCATASVAAFSSYDFYEAYETDASTVLLLQSVAFYALGFALVGGGVLVGATSLVALQTRLLPRWLSIPGLVLGGTLVLGVWALFVAFPVPALVLWVLVASIALALRRVPEQETA